MKVTTEQGLLLGEMMVYNELWLTKWNQLIELGYKPKNEIKFKGNQFKEVLERMQTDMFNTMRQKMSKEDASAAEQNYMNRVQQLELLIKDYDLGNVRIE